MNQFFNKFHALMMHAKSAGCRPTRWSFGFGSREEIMRHLDFTLDNLHPQEKLFGIPTEFDPDLPDMRAAHRSYSEVTPVSENSRSK